MTKMLCMRQKRLGVCKNGYEGNGIVCSKKGEVLLYIVTVATQVLIYIHKVIMPIIIHGFH